MDQLGGELRSHLVRFGRRLRWRDGWLLAQRWLWLACAAGALIQLAGRLWPVERLWLWALAPLVAWLLIIIALSLLKPLPSVRVARRLDAELALKERLATALMLEGRETGFQLALVALQRQDALKAARSIDLRRALPLRWLKRPLWLAAALLTVAVALAVLPNPMDAVLAERAAVAQAAEEQAKAIEELHQQIQNAQELTPEMREDLLRQLAELAKELRANRGDREEALADLSRAEDALRREFDPNVDARQAALEALNSQLQAMAQSQADEVAPVEDVAEALEQLAESLDEMEAGEREALTSSLAQMAARAAQGGDADLAQALAALAQAGQSGDSQAAGQAAQRAAEAFSQAQGELADQAALGRALSELQAGRQAIAQAGQGQALTQGQGQSQRQGQGQGQGQGQSQGQPGGGGGTKADTLPPGSSVGRARRPQGEGRPGTTGEFEQGIYVPWERRPGDGEQLSIPGQDTGQGETQIRERENPLPGAPGQALVPYQQVYHEYLDAANQTMERSYIPPGLKGYVRDYFSQLEP
jgi:hypothetical protein